MIQVVIKFLPLALNVEDAGEYLGSPKLLADMRKAGWVRPCPNARAKLTLFDRTMLESAYARYRAGEYPQV